MNRMYLPTPDGYCGDEDNGQTSAFYIFSALGFYPVCPGSDEYILGSPLFKECIVRLENGKTITLKAPDNSDANRYINRLLINGTEVSRNYLTFDELMSGVTLEFEMTNTANRERGTGFNDKPYSFSLREKKKTPTLGRDAKKNE